MTAEYVIDEAQAFITENFLYTRPDVVLGTEHSLLARGIIDSMGVMELVEFVTDRFGVVVADDHITEDNFGSLGGIARYVMSRSARTEGRNVA